MNNLDRTDGDIDSLMARIAHIRTWTYITHRSDWVDGATSWQEQARGIEDRLSDALHERITQRFVDRRSAFLVRRLASDDELIASVSSSGEVRVEGAYVGRLEGLRFVPDAIDGIEMRMVNTAANRVLRGEIASRARLLAADADEAFTIDAAGGLRWRGGVVGRLVAGERMLTPRVEAIGGDFVEGDHPRKDPPALGGVCPHRDRTPARPPVRDFRVAAWRCCARPRISARRRAGEPASGGSGAPSRGPRPGGSRSVEPKRGAVRH